MLSMIIESSLTDLIRRHTIRDGGTIQIFLESKIREEHLRMLKTNILPDFRHNNTISSGRNNEDIHPIEWLIDARAPEVHYDQ
jgi:hypothetical protein